MLAKIYSYGINGLDAYPVTIEADAARGLPGTIIVGLPDNAIRESKERVRTAIKNSGYLLEPRRMTVNLSPADTKKGGPSFDLAIALGILAAHDQIDTRHLENFAILGELSLDGSIQSISGALSAALAMKDTAFQGLILPLENAPEAAMAGGTKIFPARTLKEAIHILSQPENAKPFSVDLEQIFQKANHYDIDFAEVKGQTHAKRGLEIAAAGGHNILMIGPPGSGKSMLAKRLPTILPDMTLEEALETTKIHSVMGLLKSSRGIMAVRPFRSPHHTCSDAAVIGGGSIPKPGEVTLSHHGVLFLDELPEFNRSVLESLRQPLEDRSVTVARASKSLKFPAQFMLAAAMNPCPCGWYTDPKKECHCAPLQIQRYLARISGPLLDRIDIHIEVPALPPMEMMRHAPAESSANIKERTSAARLLQQKRFAKTAIFANAQMNHRQIKEFCGLSDESKSLLRTAIEELSLSARAYDKILKIARTIADLDCARLAHSNQQAARTIADLDSARKNDAAAEDIQPEHIAEAIQYRSLDRNWWG